MRELLERWQAAEARIMRPRRDKLRSTPSAVRQHPRALDLLGRSRMPTHSTSKRYAERPRVCTVPGCGKKHFGRGYCGMHYNRLWKAGALPPRTLEERFWEKVGRREPDECWDWQATASAGYGQIKVAKQMRKATHVVWRLTYGQWPPPQLSVCHACDNTLCVNPAHLFLAPHALNMRDMALKGRGKAPRLLGAANPSSKLDEEAVRSIRERYARGDSQAAIARAFGVHREYVGKIVRRQARAHV